MHQMSEQRRVEFDLVIQRQIWRDHRKVTMTVRIDTAVFGMMTRRSSDIYVYFETATKTVITRLLLLLQFFLLFSLLKLANNNGIVGTWQEVYCFDFFLRTEVILVYLIYYMWHLKFKFGFALNFMIIPKSRKSKVYWFGYFFCHQRVAYC